MEDGGVTAVAGRITLTFSPRRAAPKRLMLERSVRLRSLITFHGRFLVEHALCLWLGSRSFLPVWSQTEHECLCVVCENVQVFLRFLLLRSSGLSTVTRPLSEKPAVLCIAGCVSPSSGDEMSSGQNPDFHLVFIKAAAKRLVQNQTL